MVRTWAGSASSNHHKPSSPDPSIPVLTGSEGAGTWFTHFRENWLLSEIPWHVGHLPLAEREREEEEESIFTKWPPQTFISWPYMYDYRVRTQEFGVVRTCRTSPNHSDREGMRMVGSGLESSGWFWKSSKTYTLLAANSQGNIKVWDLLYSTVQCVYYGIVFVHHTVGPGDVLRQ